jgi:cyclophilin family peptidyl-prolyl cis-trans isomerase
MKTSIKKEIIFASVVVLGLVGWMLYKISQQKPTPLDTAVDLYSTEQTPVTPPVDNESTETNSPTAPTNSSEVKNNMHKITIETALGKIVFETYDADAPKTVENFITLANKGFYDGLIFHRVISGFMIQGGDPTGTGRGGPGYAFADELDPSTESYKKGYVRGTVAMANAGPNTNGSQFFIMHNDTPLQHDYTIFGHVIEGLEVVDKIVSVPVDGTDRPFQPIKMDKVTVETVSQ